MVKDIMRANSFHIKTQKEYPADSDIASYGLMIRSGIVKRLSSGIYTYMPTGLRVIKKIENIIRKEMNGIGGIEILTPIIQPAELWKVTNRWESLGNELLRIKDRHNRDFVVQPTSEEVFTDIAKNEIQSWKQLPKIFYQIQTKFRDERRPRFGVMRAREFIMKDAYSFDLDTKNASGTYEKMLQCYKSIFNKIGLDYKIVKADTGTIGGDKSHEFQVIAKTGEDEIAFSNKSDFSENIELAKAVSVYPERSSPKEKMQIVRTTNAYKCEDVANFLRVSPKKIVKSLLITVSENLHKNSTEMATDKQINISYWLILLRSDHSLNELKLNNVFSSCSTWRFANNDEIEKIMGCQPGSIGPVNLNKAVRVLVDKTVENMSDFIVGANKNEFHFIGVNWLRDLNPPDLIDDIRNVVNGDPTPDGKGVISIQRGIEVGHIFYLGDKYSKEIGANIFLEDGSSVSMEMGCYGIGVSRLIAAAVEQSHDEKGIIWPRSIAPFEVVICPIGILTNADVRKHSNQIYSKLISLGCDVIIDDRGERPGVMFAEWELIGVPLRVTIGPKSIESGKVEIYFRHSDTKVDCSIDEIVNIILENTS